MSTPPPTVTLAVQPGTIVLGQSATLTWNSSAGTSCSASGAWNGARSASGSESVTPSATGSATFTLDCGGTAYTGSATASATVAVTAPSAYSTTTLIADTVGVGALTRDANLVNAWGIAFGPTTFVWVANNHTETSTLYDGNGKLQPAAAPLVVHIPDGAAGASFDPTGIVFNGSSDFVVSSAGKSGAARFIFDGEGGMIAGWSSGVDAGNAVIVYTDTGGAIYKGLAIASNGAGNFLYATDFRNNKIDVFDASFRKQTPTDQSFAFNYKTAARDARVRMQTPWDLSFAFMDPTLSAGYAPFGIQAVKNGPNGTTQIYVSYAQQAGPNDPDNVNGAGLGLVDVFDANGGLVTHLVPTGGRLNAPWGMALAPADFGTLSNTLLVGNFGDGQINGYDPVTGKLVGTLSDPSSKPFAVPGLWGLAFGNDAANQPHNTLFWAAGTNDEANGAYGRIDLGASPPVLNAPPVVAVSAPTGNVSGTIAVGATATSTINIAKVEFFANGTTSLGVSTTSPYSVQWDTTTVANGAVTLTARATDANGNVATSSAVTVTVTNGAAAVTLAQLQALVFSPRCSGCHDGSIAPGGALPGSQDLRAGQSFASLVNVPSQEQPGLMRVKPGDPDNSYLVRKLQGTSGISGSRMPLGGPFLDQATIDQVRAWIASGLRKLLGIVF
ncbi:MAG: TIGR03118 family protein [Gammaproteobacteria bacterium]|nr:TIGR03118 family protein [Gammaproteobacteria bacterium]